MQSGAARCSLIIKPTPINHRDQCANKNPALADFNWIMQQVQPPYKVQGQRSGIKISLGQENAVVCSV